MNVLRCVVLVLVCIFPGSGWCQIADGERLAIPVRPEVGQAWIVNAVWERTVTRHEKTLVDYGGRILASIEVTAVSDAGYDIVWTTRSATEQVVPLEPGFVDPQWTLSLPMVVRLDTFGSSLELKNWDSIRGDLVDKFAKQHPNPAKLAYFRDMVNGWDAAAAVGFVLTSMPALTICQGLEVIAGPPMRVEEYIWSPFDGSDIKAIGTYILREVDREGGIAKIGLEREIGPEAAMEWGKEALNRLVKGLGTKSGKMADDLASYKLVNNQSAECTVDLSTGLTKAVDHSLTVTIGHESARMVRRVVLQPIAGNQ